MKNTLERMQRAAKERNGKCLSKENTTCTTKVEWECEKGHRWLAQPNRIYVGKWCKKCADLVAGKNKVISKEKIIKFIENKNGQILNINEHKNAYSRLNIQCSNGHIWNTCWHNLKSCNNWCKKCADIYIKGKYHIDTIDNIKIIAKKRGGKCLNDNYINAYAKLDFICSKNHKFSMNAHDLKTGRWCKNCSSFRTERMIRKFLSYLCQKEFVKIRPVWLNRLELDGYNDELKIAFEYNGIQHYRYFQRYHKNINDFIKVQNNDKTKRHILLSKNIKLLDIKYTMKDKELKNYIINFLEKENIPISLDYKNLNLKDFID